MAVVGGGNTALEDAFFLATLCPSVWLVCRRGQFRGDRQLIDSVAMLINNAESYYNKIYVWVTNLLEKNPEIAGWMETNLENYYNDLMKVLTEQVLPGAQQMLTTITGGIWTGIWGLVTFTTNFLVGIIISVYLLAMKEKSLARCCKLLYALLQEEQARWMVRATRKTNQIFSGFVRGKMLDSLIIGILCFIGCSIFSLPYTPLVSVVVGVTNMIPFFGPFLGAAPSAFLILLVSPKQCLIFIVFIIVLQQIDGNIIGPKILGDATGISSFWVVVAITVGGGFAGVLGMFLGVPIFACLQTLVKYLTDRQLEKRHMPLEACEYVHRDQEPMPPEEPPAPPTDSAAPAPASSEGMPVLFCGLPGFCRGSVSAFPAFFCKNETFSCKPWGNVVHCTSTTAYRQALAG